MALKMKSSNEDSSSYGVMNLIASGTYLEGTIETKGSLRVDGKVKGTVRTGDMLHVGPSGEIIGEVYAKVARVAGKIEGDINVEQKLTLEATSTLNGNLKTAKLMIDEGAVFNGKAEMGKGGVVSGNDKKTLFEKPRSAEEMVSGVPQKK